MAEQCLSYEREWTLRMYAAAAAAEASVIASETLLRTPKEKSHHIQESVSDHRARTSAVKMAKTKAQTHRAVSPSSNDQQIHATSKTSGSTH